MNEVDEHYIIQIDNLYLSEFLFCWVYYNQPCDLLALKPNTQGCTAIKLVVSNVETANFLLKAKEKTGCILHKMDK